MGQGGQLPQILADQKAPPGSGGAPHYYLPHRIFDPWCIPVYGQKIVGFQVEIKEKFCVDDMFYKVVNAL